MTDETTFTRREAAGLLAGASVAAASAVAAAPPRAEPRIDALIARMTLEEKAAQLVGVDSIGKALIEDEHGRFDPARASAAFPHGFGHLCSPSFPHNAVPGKDPMRGAGDTARYMNAVQDWARRTGPGIPVLAHEEALHGLRARDATSFPQAIGLASSWDPDLVTRVFAHAAAETRARGAHMVLAPVVDMARDPRWGRCEETFGEDTHLCAEMGVAAIRGFQGGALPLGPGRVLVSVKHFAAHGAPENGTNLGPVPIGERTLRDSLLPPYEAAVKRGGAASVMSAYHELDGVPCSGNAWLLDLVLRREWGFEGMVVSDYKAVKELADLHHVAADHDAAAVLALTAGVDVELPDGACYLRLPALVRAGRVPAALLDRAVRRVLRAKLAAGLFDAAPADPDAAEVATGNAAARALAHAAALKTIVLLKNDHGALPLNPARTGTLAVLGQAARATPIGEYSDVPRQIVSVLDALNAEAAGGAFRVRYAEGVRVTATRDWYNDTPVLTPPDVARTLREEAVRVARGCDRVLMVLGDNEETAREAWAANHLGDRASLDLFGEQQALFDAVAALGKPIVVLLLNGRPPSIPVIAAHADAILEGWYLGQETGRAVADILFGRANPGGKLPISIPRSVGQLPVYYAAKPSARRNYLDSTTEPLWAFGHGLSYTRFELSAPRLPRDRLPRGQDVTVEVDVANVGARAGDEVVQVYVHDLVASVTRPVRELKAFRRVTLAAGERRTVRLVLAADAFALWDGRMRRVVEPGAFEILAGPNLAALKSATLTLY